MTTLLLANYVRLDCGRNTFGDSISSAIYDFSDYFQYREVNGEPAILIQKNTTIIDLQKRFVGYLPIDVLSILVNEIQKLVA